MDTIIEKLFSPNPVEYLVVSYDLIIIEASFGVQSFTDDPTYVNPGKDVRVGFPELIKYENKLIEIIEGPQKSFALKGIAGIRELIFPCYIDWFIVCSANNLFFFLQDAAEKMILEDNLLSGNETDYFLTDNLFNALSSAYNYIDKLLTSIRDALFITTNSGNIITVNQTALELFEYNQEELILQPISTIINDENFLKQTFQLNPFSKSDFFHDCEVVCQTKTQRKLFISFSAVSTEIEGLQHFVYVGRDITQRKRTEQLQDVEHTTTRILASSTTISEATTKILSNICSNLGWDLGEFWSLDRQTNELQLNSTWQVPNVHFGELELLSHQNAFSLQIWARGEPVWINDLQNQEDSLSREAVKQGFHGAFGFPVKCVNEIKGVMTFFSRNIQQLQPDLLTVMTIIGSQIGQFILRFQAEAALRESEKRFQAFMNNTPAIAFMKDSQGRYVYVNKTLERNFNIQLVDLYGKTDFDWLPEKTAKQMRESDLHVISTGKAAQVIETLPTPDGCLHYWLVFKFLFQDGEEQQLVGGVAVDITERKLLEQALFEEKELAQVTLQSIGDAVITTDASGQIKYLNPVAEQLTGWSLQDAQGKPLAEVFKVVNETTRETMENPVEQALSSGSSLVKNNVLITRNGSEIPINDSAAPIRGRDGEIMGMIIVFQDVSQIRTMARQLSWQATHDALTGLFNRREFEYRLEQAINNAKTENLQHTLCYLDLDKFKIVNDTCGHMAGDELLRQVTALLQSSVRSSDTLARLGGDEFAILLEFCPLEAALRITNTILQRIQEFCFVWQDKTFNIGVSIGLLVFNADSQSMSSVLSAADAACYVAKNNGRNRVHIYQAELE